MKGNETTFLFKQEKRTDTTFFENVYVFKFPYTDEFIKRTIHAGSDKRLEFIHDELKGIIERLIRYLTGHIL